MIDNEKKKIENAINFYMLANRLKYATTDKKQNIIIRIADVEPFALSIPADDEALYLESEKLVKIFTNMQFCTK